MAAKKTLSKEEVLEKIKDLWSVFSEEEKTVLKERMHIQTFKKNERIYCEGEKPLYMMCLITGKVKIYRTGVNGRSQIIRVKKPVQYFGVRAYFANENYITAAAAFEASTICFLPMDIIMKVISKNTQLSLFFIRLLSIHLGTADKRTVSLTQKHIRGRLAEALLFLRDHYGLEEDGATLSIYLSREDLANLSNMTTSNAIRTLSTFAQDKLLAIDGRKIKIIDEERLRRISRIGD